MTDALHSRSTQGIVSDMLISVTIKLLTTQRNVANVRRQVAFWNRQCASCFETIYGSIALH